MNRSGFAILRKAIAFAVVMPLVVFGASRESDWKKVEEAMNKGLPRSAIELLDPIIAAALKEKAYAEAAKAICKKIVLESIIQGNKPEERIIRMDRAIQTAPAEIKPLLLTLQAHWYWQYFQNNRWRFLNRTRTAQPPGSDFTTWDLPRLFNEIDKLYSQALASAEVLKKTPISVFDEFLVKGTVPDSYRPTVYDFVAYQALEFYTSGEQAAAKPADAFEISADSPIFDSADRFISWRPQTDDVTSPKLQAILIYQALLEFHKNDKDGSAFADADLARLNWGWSVSVGDSKSERYKAALKVFIDRWVEHEISTMAIYHLARVIKEEGDFVKAREIALRGAKVFPNSPGSNLCKNLITEIEAKSLELMGEVVWSRPFPKIDVKYRNIDIVHFRAYAVDWERQMQKGRYYQRYLNDDELINLLKEKPAAQWSAKLKPQSDYKEHLQQVPATEDLKPGFYYLIASHREDFSRNDNQMAYLAFWVSEIEIVVYSHSGTIRGLVVEADSGKPVANALVSVWTMNQNGGFNQSKEPIKTDETGYFAIPGVNERGVVLCATSGEQKVATFDVINSWRQNPPAAREQVFFFTDRAIYRPGQNLYYKGILVYVDSEKDQYRIIPKRKVTVIFSDPNGKEVARQEVESNDFGSFNGVFTTPSDRLMGNYSLRLLGGPPGATSVSVEEYKRPKFNVVIQPPKEGVRLNDKVIVKGVAEAFTGAPIDGAEVKWRVVRDVHYPVWWWGWRWRYYPQPQAAQEIGFGVAKTATDGSFEIGFIAKPDPSVSAESEASFTFTVYADVTDSSGETRSGRRFVNVGFTALSAQIQTDEWQTSKSPVACKVYTKTFDDEPQIAEGSIKIYRLKEPQRVHRSLSMYPNWWSQKVIAEETGPDLSNPLNWDEAELVAEKGITTSKEGVAVVDFNLKAGCYRAVFETVDKYGKKVTARRQITVLDPEAERLSIKIPNILTAPKWSVEPGEEFLALWGTGYESGRAFIQIEHRGKVIKQYWTSQDRTQHLIKLPITEEFRGGFTLHVAFVRENAAYLESRRIEVPWSNKELDLSFEHFTSKLQPAQKEYWSILIKPKSGVAKKETAEKRAAELVATLYDESLDMFRQNVWMNRFNIFRNDYSTMSASFCNHKNNFNYVLTMFSSVYISVEIRYRDFPPDIIQGVYWYFGRGVRSFGAEFDSAARFGNGIMAKAAAPAPGLAATLEAKDHLGEVEKATAGVDKRKEIQSAVAGEDRTGAPPSIDLSSVTARKNLNETAFFYPQLISDENGVVKIQFEMPEALTKWKFIAFAHDTLLRSGSLTASATTSKDIMVQPNPPRFVREGDILIFPVKISNRTTERQRGKARLNFMDAASGKDIDRLLGNTVVEVGFDVPAGESRTYSWQIIVPDGAPYIHYKAVASTGKVSDGEEGYIPTLSRRIFVTESLPLPIRGEGVKKFRFESLLKSKSSTTLRHQGLVVQMVSQPAWYAVMALPYLMEYPYECSEQVFNRYYANALARHIANSDAKIRRIFDLWKGTPALDSPLEKNQDLKSVMLEETPWYRAAQNESQARRNVGILFEENRLNNELRRALAKLKEMQLADGYWSWFPGGPKSEYITLYIVTGFGRLRHLGVDTDIQCAIKALPALDGWISDIYNRIIQYGVKDRDNLSETIALYLYCRSFFLKDKAIDEANREAFDYFVKQARQYWLRLPRQSQAHIAIGLKRINLFYKNADDTTPTDIVRSLKERAVYDEEMGMFWRDTELSWWWYRAPIETQAMMIEVFDEVASDAKAVEECKTWLLKQKQTQDWKTTKATADAVYALLLRGTNWLASDKLVEVVVGGINITPGKSAQKSAEEVKVEPGTGFYEKRFSPEQIKPSLGEITVKKSDAGVSWGSVHWQYLEDMSKVKPYAGTPLKLKKSIFIRETTKRGKELVPIRGSVSVGDELIVRIELRVDRDMEYVHLKDQRPSGVEPVNVLSGCRSQDGLIYYETTRDTASHFFIHYLPKGTYVFEYPVRVQHRGKYQTGIASIQCMYAPEFNSHSESILLEAK
ncbi:MAG: MG2 domain-containing protein [Verrucomicrobiia bacterium]